MTQVPANPKIYHITHVDNLAKIVAAGCIWSDAKRIDLQLETNLVGMSRIKRRRLETIDVSCHPGTKVGQYVPFYYCPRSIMLYILHRGNHPDIDYTEGQAPIVHLQSDLRQCLRWAEENDIAWALTPSNAGALYADFYNSKAEFGRIDWQAVANRDFRGATVKEGKQAEFLVLNSFPWSLVEHVGVFDQKKGVLAKKAIARSRHRPTIRVENGWYF